MVSLTVNGQVRQFDGDPDMPLLWYVRDVLGLTGSKFGCGVASCGACTMIVEGTAVRSCVTPVAAVEGQKVTTIEGLSGPVAQAVQDAWRKLDVVQCGYCQSGQIMSAVALLSDNPKPSADDTVTGMDGNICRCATYYRIRDAVAAASSNLKG